MVIDSYLWPGEDSVSVKGREILSESVCIKAALDNFTSSLDSAAIRVVENHTPVYEPPSELLTSSKPSTKAAGSRPAVFVGVPESSVIELSFGLLSK